MSNTDRDSLLERWATGMETLEQYYESLYGPPGTPATLPDVTNRDGMLEAIADGLERAQININKHSTTYHNTGTAYVKTVPALVSSADIESIGGKTLVLNQLVDTGTTSVPTISGRKYYTLLDGTASVVTSDGTAISVVDDSADMVTDLTLCFGEGNEPSANGFAEIFPNAHYAYNEGQLLSASVDEIVSKDSNGTELDSFEVPASVQALEGYGWATGNVYNEVDLVNKKFIQRVGKYTFTGDEAWVQASAGSLLTTVLADSAKFAAGQYVVCDRFVGSSSGVAATHIVEGYCWLHNATQYKRLYVYSPTHTTSTIGAYTAGMTVYYPLATPVETDISAYLDDNTIRADGSGTLTFENSNGDGYRLPVPSTEMFWVDRP